MLPIATVPLQKRNVSISFQNYTVLQEFCKNISSRTLMGPKSSDKILFFIYSFDIGLCEDLKFDFSHSEN